MNPCSLRSNLPAQVDTSRGRGAIQIHGPRHFGERRTKHRKAWETEGDVGCFLVGMVLVLYQKLAPRTRNGSSNARPPEVFGDMVGFEMDVNILVEPGLRAYRGNDAVSMDLGSNEMGPARLECCGKGCAGQRNTRATASKNDGIHLAIDIDGVRALGAEMKRAPVHRHRKLQRRDEGSEALQVNRALHVVYRWERGRVIGQQRGSFEGHRVVQELKVVQIEVDALMCGVEIRLKVKAQKFFCRKIRRPVLSRDLDLRACHQTASFRAAPGLNVQPCRMYGVPELVLEIEADRLGGRPQRDCPPLKFEAQPTHKNALDGVPGIHVDPGERAAI